MSNYAEKLKQESIGRFDREMQLRKFREQFKSQIENGLTLEELKQKYCLTSTDIENFNIVSEEVKREAALGEAFLKGFQER